jgi:hypothetical protein
MPTTAHTTAQDQQAYKALLDLLLAEEREKVQQLKEELNSWQKNSITQDGLKLALQPEIESFVVDFKATFPEMFGPVITQAIKIQIRDSQDEVVKALYPIMGKLIRKYISAELEQLKDTINSRVNQITNPNNIWAIIKAKLFGISTSDVILADIAKSEIEQSMLIHKASGKIIGQYSKNNDIDPDIVGGMLTLVKNFMEDAFKAKNEELETIDYGSQKLLIISELEFMAVLVIHGDISKKGASFVRASTQQFLKDNSKLISTGYNGENYNTLSFNLQQWNEKINKTSTK